MTIRFLAAAALLAALSSPALAQADAPAAASQPAAPAAARPELVPVAIETSLGRIVVALDKTDAPVTTANFLRYVDAHRFDGEAFYRAMRVGSGGGLIQGGISSDARKLYPPIAHEPTTKTGLHDVAGAIAMANAGAGTARADFFILASDMPSLDATADQPGFAVFGHVIEGMDVVQKILAAPVSETKGEGVMKGQMLDPTIKIIRMSRLAPSKP
jgi:peptidyl-prolyl cis-trans isomerase A (cyclophilin A)